MVAEDCLRAVNSLVKLYINKENKYQKIMNYVAVISPKLLHASKQTKIFDYEPHILANIKYLPISSFGFPYGLT